MFLVTGATGNIGGKLVQLLAEQGHPVRALVRDPAKAHFPAGVEVAVADLDDADSVARAAKGAAGIFHMQRDPGTAQTETMISAARTAGVDRIVALTSVGAVGAPQAGMGSLFRAREELLRASGLTVTFLRPDAFMTNTLWKRDEIRRSGTVTDPSGEGLMPLVDTDDIAAVAAVALTEDGHEGHGYLLTGSEAFTTREQVAILAEVLGREIEYISVTPHEFAEASIAEGTPVEMARMLENLHENFRLRRSVVLTDDVFNVTGKRPGTFRAWCERNADAFR